MLLVLLLLVLLLFVVLKKDEDSHITSKMYSRCTVRAVHISIHAPQQNPTSEDRSSTGERLLGFSATFLPSVSEITNLPLDRS